MRVYETTSGLEVMFLNEQINKGWRRTRVLTVRSPYIRPGGPGNTSFEAEGLAVVMILEAILDGE